MENKDNKNIINLTFLEKKKPYILSIKYEKPDALIKLLEEKFDKLITKFN